MKENVNRITVRNKVVSSITIQLTRPITDPDDFTEELQMLAAADHDDKVKMLIVSPGGQMDTCGLIRKAMAECQAPITGWIGGTCASAGSAIALACDEWEVDEESMLMIHTASFGDYGKAPELEASVAAKLRQVRRWVTNVYTGFLTEEEIENVIAGKDYYFDVDNGLCERLQAYAEYRDQMQAERILEMQSQLAELEEELLSHNESLDNASHSAVELASVEEQAPAKRRKPTKATA